MNKELQSFWLRSNIHCEYSIVALYFHTSDTESKVM